MDTLKPNSIIKGFTRSLKYKSSPKMETKKSPVNRSASHADSEQLLIHAVAHEDIDTIKRILRNKDVQIDALRHPGLSALHHVCLNGNMKIMKLFVAHDPNMNLNLKSKDGFTPLKLAVLHGHFDISQLLIEKGASLAEIKDGVFNWKAILNNNVKLRL